MGLRRKRVSPSELSSSAAKMSPRHVSLIPATELAAKVSRPFPNDSAAYREACLAVQVAAIELRRQIERVAEQRRSLPPGGIAGDYGFSDEGDREIGSRSSSALTTLSLPTSGCIGLGRKRPCPMCTAFVSLDIPARDIFAARVAIAVRRSPVALQVAFARERDWRKLKFFATLGLKMDYADG